MDDHKLTALVKQIRAAFERTHSQMTGDDLWDFPNCCCEPVSILAHAVLVGHGYTDTRIYQGMFDDGTGHYWLRTDGMYIDITHDQEAISGAKLYGFTLDDHPYEETYVYKLSSEDIAERVVRLRLQSDIENFMKECLT
ncbi:MAG: hypothetical protein ACNI27_10745 [Desulfovibrio sp.]